MSHSGASIPLVTVPPKLSFRLIPHSPPKLSTNTRSWEEACKKIKKSVRGMREGVREGARARLWTSETVDVSEALEWLIHPPYPGLTF